MVGNYCDQGVVVHAAHVYTRIQDAVLIMNGKQLPANRLRRLKWLILSVTILAITASEILRAFQQNKYYLNLIYWILGVIAAIVLVELTFRKIASIQGQLDNLSQESQTLLRQQNSLLQMSKRLATAKSAEEICQIISHELQDTLGAIIRVACVVNEPSSKTIGYAETNQKSVDFSELQPPVQSQPTGAEYAGEISPGIALSNDIHQLSIPMQIGEKSIGKLIIEYKSEKEISEDILSILQGVANQAALSIENARLVSERRNYQQAAERQDSELHARERHLTLLNEFTRTTLKSQDFQVTMQVLVENLGKLLEADGVLIIFWDETRKQMVPAAAYGPLRQIYRSLRIESNDLPLVASVLNVARTLEIADTSNSPYISPRLATQLQIKSLLAMPLISDEQKIGIALISRKAEHTFSSRETNLAEQATNQLALSIAKNRAVDALQHRTQELSALQKATTALLTTLDLEVLLGQILDAVISAIPASEKGTLHLVARDTGQLQLRAVQGYTDPRIRIFNPTDSASFVATSVRERKQMLIHDAHADPRTRYGGDIPEIRAISSMIIAPLILGGKTLGAISLDAYRRYAFTDGDLQLLVSFAATATTAIQNAQLYAEVQKQAITDPLTALYNRRGFFELGRREVERAHRFDRPLTAMMIDIDLFKQVNDTQGHLIGDQVLAGVASQIEHQLRQVDLPGRYGGDEFIALLPETDLFNAYQAAERLRRSIAKVHYPTENEPVRVTVSIGIASLKASSDSLETIIERADQALYSAKQSGRNRTMQENTQTEK